MPRDTSLRKHQLANDTARIITRVSFQIQARPEEVSSCLQDIRNAFEEAGLPAELRINAEVVLAEILNNIVEHSFADQPAGYIKIKLELSTEHIDFLIIDNGKQMPDLVLPNPELPSIEVDVTELPEGGFGWFLIRSLTTDLAYARFDAANHLSARILLKENR